MSMLRSHPVAPIATILVLVGVGISKLIVPLFAVASLASGSVAGQDAPLNLRNAMSAGDLDYTKPATRSEEGMPVGNGKMGSLVWTTPAALKFQINRVDVFGQDSATVSFPRGNTDYASRLENVVVASVSDGSFSL